MDAQTASAPTAGSDLDAIASLPTDSATLAAEIEGWLVEVALGAAGGAPTAREVGD